MGKGPVTNLDVLSTSRVAAKTIAPVKYMTGGYQEYQQEELAKPQTPPDK